MRHTFGWLALVILGIGQAAGQNNTTNPPAKQPVAERTKTERMVYIVRYGDAKSLATTLSQHYKNEVDLQIVADANSNALLVTAPMNLLVELTKTVEQLDRRPRLVTVDVLVVELPVEEDATLDPKDFEKPIDKIMPSIEALSKKGKVTHLRRFQMAALENQKSTLTSGDTKPVISGVVNVGGGGGFGGKGGGGGVGGMQNQIIYRQVGCVLSATPRISNDGTITIDMNFEESRIVTPENGVPLGGGVVAAETPTTNLKGSISVANGRTVLAQGVKTDTKGEKKTQTLVIVGAQILDK